MQEATLQETRCSNMGQDSKPLLALLLLLMLVNGNCRQQCLACMAHHINVDQMDTGHKVGPDNRLFQVTVTNGCCCTVKDLAIASDGFQSAIQIDPRLFRWNAEEEDYLVGDGDVIPSNKSVTFFYAWRVAFRMDVVGMQVLECS